MWTEPTELVDINACICIDAEFDVSLDLQICKDRFG